MLTPASACSSRRFERRFYQWTSWGLFHTAGLPALLQIHGAVVTGWVVWLLVQSSLITAHPAFGRGALAVLGRLHVAFHLTTTPTWIAFARRMVS